MIISRYFPIASLVAAFIGTGCQTASFQQGMRPVRVNEKARNESRIDSLEMQVQQLSLKVDECMQTQQFARDTIDEQNREIQSLRSELESARADSSAAKSELASLKAEQGRISKSVNELPTKISSLVGSASSSRGSSSSSSRGSGEYYEHVVERGQTVSDIARAYNVRSEDIVRENNLGAKAMIRVGQKLLVPKE